MELKNRIAKASVCGERWSSRLRHHQHFDWLARFKWQPVQNELAMVTDSSLSPVCFHALSIEDSLTLTVPLCLPFWLGDCLTNGKS